MCESVPTFKRGAAKPDRRHEAHESFRREFEWAGCTKRRAHPRLAATASMPDVLEGPASLPALRRVRAKIAGMDDEHDIGGPCAGLDLRVVRGDDLAMRRVADLCYETLHRPFGVSRNDSWNELDPASVHLVAFDGDRVAGYARLLFEGRWAHVRQVSVDPAYRHRGIASVLVRTLVDEARGCGVDGVYLNARGRAVGMYERLGFRTAGPVFRMPRTWLPHVRMERVLR